MDSDWEREPWQKAGLTVRFGFGKTIWRNNEENTRCSITVFLQEEKHERQSYRTVTKFGSH